MGPGPPWFLPLDLLPHNFCFERETSRALHQAGIIVSGHGNYWRRRFSREHGLYFGFKQYSLCFSRTLDLPCLRALFRPAGLQTLRIAGRSCESNLGIH